MLHGKVRESLVSCLLQWTYHNYDEKWNGNYLHKIHVWLRRHYDYAIAISPLVFSMKQLTLLV